MNKKHLIIVVGGAIIAVIVAIILSITIHTYIQVGQIRLPAPPFVSPPPVAKHTFKVKEIYPTKPDGREGFINMADPEGDKLFDPASSISKEPDGSWRVGDKADGEEDNNNEDQVRMKVGTPEDEPQWKNVEITGYVKVLRADSPTDHVDWYA
jgi:hypothetical protein